jgi:hypothetical protein
MCTSSTLKALDRITHATGAVLDASVFASLVNRDQELLVSSCGVAPPIAMLLLHAFRKHVVATGHPLVIFDARQDSLLARIPAVRDGSVRACVGMPFGAPRGETVGTLFVMDAKSRTWTGPQLDLLHGLSRLILSGMEHDAALRRVFARYGQQLPSNRGDNLEEPSGATRGHRFRTRADRSASRRAPARTASFSSGTCNGR